MVPKYINTQSSIFSSFFFIPQHKCRIPQMLPELAVLPARTGFFLRHFLRIAGSTPTASRHGQDLSQTRPQHHHRPKWRFGLRSTSPLVKLRVRHGRPGASGRRRRSSHAPSIPFPLLERVNTYPPCKKWPFTCSHLSGDRALS